MTKKYIGYEPSRIARDEVMASWTPMSSIDQDNVVNVEFGKQA